MQLVEGNCLRTKAGELLHITKIHCSVNNLEKLVSIMGYMDETLFWKDVWEDHSSNENYGTNFSCQSPVAFLNYKCFMFRDIDMTSTIEEYA